MIHSYSLTYSYFISALCQCRCFAEIHFHVYIISEIFVLTYTSMFNHALWTNK